MKGGLSCIALALGLLTETLFALGQTTNPTAVAQGPSSAPPSGVLVTPPPAPVLVPPSGVLPNVERSVTRRPLKMAEHIHIAKSSTPGSMRRQDGAGVKATAYPPRRRGKGTTMSSEGHRRPSQRAEGTSVQFPFSNRDMLSNEKPQPLAAGAALRFDFSKPLRASSLPRRHGITSTCSSADRLRNGRRFGRGGHISATRPGLFVERH